MYYSPAAIHAPARCIPYPAKRRRPKTVDATHAHPVARPSILRSEPAEYVLSLSLLMASGISSWVVILPVQHAVPYPMMMPPGAPGVPPHPYEGQPAPPVQMGGVGHA